MLNIKSKIMKFPRLFRVPEHYVFDYKPIYYDEKKEKRELREKMLTREVADESETNENYKTNIKGSFKHSMSYKQKQSKFSTVRMIIFLAFIALLVYFIFFTGIIDNIFQAFG